MTQTKKQRTIEERFADTHPHFQSSIFTLAAKYSKTWQHVYGLWLKYADACYDQSALLWEFENWYKDELAVQSIIHDAAVAQEMFTLDELEAYALTPQPGDVIIVKSSNWYASKGPDEPYLRSEGTGLIRLADIHRGRPFWGPQNAIDGGPEHLSTSGGPFIGYSALSKPRFIGTTELRCWKWKEYPCKDGGIDYTRTVRLFEADTLTDD